MDTGTCAMPACPFPAFPRSGLKAPKTEKATRLAVENRPDRFHRRHQTPRNLTIDLFKTVGPEFSLIEFLRQPGAVGMNPAHFIIRIAVFALALDPYIDGVFKGEHGRP